MMSYSIVYYLILLYIILVDFDSDHKAPQEQQQGETQEKRERFFRGAPKQKLGHTQEKQGCKAPPTSGRFASGLR